MVLIGLLLIALICLALGLVLPSAAWLIASLIASGGAGYLLIRARQTIGAGAARPGRARRAATAGSHGSASGATTGVTAGEAADNAVDNAVDKAADKDTPAADTTATAAAGAADAAEGLSPAAPGAGAAADEVWVIDGRPRYHLADCAIIQGQDAEPIPFEQATEDGFMACSLCEPNVLRSAS
jgi:hypothetical protein